MSDLYEVLDPRPIAASAPYTFFLPHDDVIAAISQGDLVQATIRSIPPSDQYDAERMWVRVKSTTPEWLEGKLESQPVDMPNLPVGATIRLRRSYVISVILDDPGRTSPAARHQQRDYRARCLVDQCVINGELKVGYLYREVPEPTKDGQKFPDSGWRIRGDMRGTSIEELAQRKAAFVALGAVLNRDDSWLHLIDEPVGARFEKDFENGLFVRES
jgi:hypothetical protein